MTPADLKKHKLPLAPVKRIMRADNDIRMIVQETVAVFAKTCEMFILDTTSQAWINNEKDGRRNVQKKDIALFATHLNLLKLAINDNKAIALSGGLAKLPIPGEEEAALLYTLVLKRCW
ncbi:nuclear transcription factor Y subunit C-2-like [Daucus carota subsp. sativus]|uniref:nuclear transcription factor Y subunit C-2-like n=1 Tax=Daucus carota subsp. sativus TaxID=79200 RepID=UPI0030838F05